MFTHLRQSAQSFFSKLILFFLVAMFVVWGIGDVFRTMGGGPNNVATVGKKVITTQAFRNAVQHHHTAPQNILAGMINDALIEQDGNAMGIAVNDDAVVEFIAELPELRGKDGQFDKDLYRRMLEQTGMSEAHFIDSVRHEISEKLLIGTLTGWVQVPEELVLTL